MSKKIQIIALCIAAFIFLWLLLVFLISFMYDYLGGQNLEAGFTILISFFGVALLFIPLIIIYGDDKGFDH